MKKHFFKPGEPKDFDVIEAAKNQIKKSNLKPITIIGLNGVVIVSYDKIANLYYDKEGNEYTQAEILKPKKK